MYKGRKNYYYYILAKKLNIAVNKILVSLTRMPVIRKKNRKHVIQELRKEIHYRQYEMMDKTKIILHELHYTEKLRS